MEINTKKIKREHVILGLLVVVRKGHRLTLNAHRTFMKDCNVFDMLEGGMLAVVTKPRKIDNINLVRVRVNSKDEYEVFCCDLLNHCELA
jgi:hypothetical protein